MCSLEIFNHMHCIYILFDRIYQLQYRVYSALYLMISTRRHVEMRSDVKSCVFLALHRADHVLLVMKLTVCRYVLRYCARFSVSMASRKTQTDVTFAIALSLRIHARYMLHFCYQLIDTQFKDHNGSVNMLALNCSNVNI